MGKSGKVNVSAIEKLIAQNRKARNSIESRAQSGGDYVATKKVFEKYAKQENNKKTEDIKSLNSIEKRLRKHQAFLTELRMELVHKKSLSDYSGRSGNDCDENSSPYVPVSKSSMSKMNEVTSSENSKREIEGLKRRLSLAQNEIKSLRRKQRSILSSRSWRLTSPLRRVSQITSGKKRLQSQRQTFRKLEVETIEIDRPSVRAESRQDLKEKKRHARKRVAHARVHLYTLGFVERGIKELELLAEDQTNAFMAPWAEWELALWHASHEDVGNKRRALAYIKRYKSHELEIFDKAAVAIVEAECLKISGKRGEAVALLENIRSPKAEGDLSLGRANLYKGEEKLSAINSCFTLYGLETIQFSSDIDRSLYDRIIVDNCSPLTNFEGEPPRVTVIVPVFNAEKTVYQTMNSLLYQTWPNLEVIVVDDSSTDKTFERVKAYENRFERLVVLRNEDNLGPYVARNNALKIATGTFVTCHDADDWSHPRKIEIQARHLVKNSSVFANTSQQARAFEDLLFHRRGNKGFYIQFNLSSLMFRREQALDTIGYWDLVRFAGDSEYLARIKHVFDVDALVHLETGPVSFQRQSANSLTSSKGSSYNGYKYGARAVYEEFHRSYHEKPVSLYNDCVQQQRQFYIPALMRPKGPVNRHYDVVLASDFRLSGGTTSSNAEEIKANHALGLKTAIMQMSCYGLRIERRIDEKIRELLEDGYVDLLVYGESVSCDVLIIRQPWVLEDYQAFLPEVRASAIRVIINQPPNRDYGSEKAVLYNISQCHMNAERYFGFSGVWHPIGPLVRETLVEHHGKELRYINLSDEDWPNIINVDEWQRFSKPKPHSKIRICRLSRDHVLKWPAELKTLTSVYPINDEFEVHVLGGADTVAAMMNGRLPENWYVSAFGAEFPRDFLARYDVFVYYTHPDWVESFGRVIFEAMAVGLPVFLPHLYRPLFGNAALYAEPEELQQYVKELMSDPERYNAQVRLAQEYVRSHFGYRAHKARIEAILNSLTNSA